MNKKFSLSILTILLAVMTMLTQGCGKDDKNPKTTFTYDGETYDLTQGVLMNDTIVEGEIYQHFLLFFSDGFTIHWKDEGHTVIDSITGKGEALVFILFSSSAGEPADGKYDHVVRGKSTTFVPDPFTWYNGLAFINFTDTEEGSEGSRIGLVDGTIEVKKEDTDRFEFKVNTTTEDKKTFSAYINLKVTRVTNFSDTEEKSLKLNSFLH